MGAVTHNGGSKNECKKCAVRAVSSSLAGENQGGQEGGPSFSEGGPVLPRGRGVDPPPTPRELASSRPTARPSPRPIRRIRSAICRRFRGNGDRDLVRSENRGDRELRSWGVVFTAGPLWHEHRFRSRSGLVIKLLTVPWRAFSIQQTRGRRPDRV